ncbi:hypothetical protein [Acinetobacter guillouiae]|uniref:hypothetical protein n=1 Tax=Acinetobacter guillouiae TaxID=106649 RepID=UPI00300ABA32
MGISANFIYYNNTPNEFEFGHSILYDTVISSYEDKIISTFKDDSWDLTPYSFDRRNLKINFNYFDENNFENKYQSKVIIFSLMWLKKGNPLSLKSISNFSSVIKRIYLYCKEYELKIFDFFNNEFELKKYFKKNSENRYVEDVGALISHLYYIDLSYFNLDFKDKKIINFVRGLYFREAKETIQTYPIPSRIFLETSFFLDQFLMDWILNEKYIFYYINSIFEKHKQFDIRNTDYSVGFKGSKLEKYLSKYKRKLNLNGVCGLITLVQLSCKLVIQLYTGMRDSEVNRLKYKCYYYKEIDGVSVPIIRGFTSKLNRGIPIETEWVTNEKAIEALKVLERILIFIHKINNSNVKDNFLFISTCYLNFLNSSFKDFTKSYSLQHITFGKSKLKDYFQVRITAQDLNELNKIDPLKSYLLDNTIKIGEAWPLKSHQFRRSLAIYAQRSSLVKLSSLSKQLKHLSESMTLYYSKGFINSTNLISNSNDFYDEWQTGKIEASFIIYMEQVIENIDYLSGGHIAWRKLNSIENQYDVKKMKNDFIEHKLFYRESNIGGCTKVGDCKFDIINQVSIDCLKNNCKNLIVNTTKLNNLIKKQKILLSKLDIDSMEYHNENSFLNLLIKNFQME